MSAESDDYAAAEKAIAQALASGATKLDLSDWTELTRLPPQIAELVQLKELRLGWGGISTKIEDVTLLQGLVALQFLSLDNTHVTDIIPLRGLTALQTLSLSQTKVTVIAPLQVLTGLQTLYLDHTQVMDITPLQRMTALQYLYLSNTQVDDITPLKEMAALQNLTLSNTQVIDITPLQGLTALRLLNLNHTFVSDLRPLAELTFGLMDEETNWHQYLGLYFENTVATESSSELSKLSQIKDHETRTRDTLAYLKTLPPWPAPLPWNMPAESDRTKQTDTPSPDVPAEQPAPLQVIEINGVLHPTAPGDDLDQQGSQLAQQGWAATRDYLDDLDDQRPRIHNTMPRLAKTLDRLETALGETYDTMNPIAVGTQANRVIRLSANASDMLMDEDAADIAEFAAALSLLIERFPKWRAYRAAALSDPTDPSIVEQAIPEFHEVVEALKGHPEIAPEIATNLEEQIKSTGEDPADSIVATGLIRSVGNVLSKLANKALSELGDIAGKSWAGTKIVIAGTVVVGISKVAEYIFVTNAPLLHSLVAKLPEQLGWLQKFLNAFGL